jgi:hypothetical protein
MLQPIFMTVITKGLRKVYQDWHEISRKRWRLTNLQEGDMFAVENQLLGNPWMSCRKFVIREITCNTGCKALTG